MHVESLLGGGRVKVTSAKHGDAKVANAKRLLPNLKVNRTEIPRTFVTHGAVRNFRYAPLYAPLRTPPFLD